MYRLFSSGFIAILLIMMAGYAPGLNT